MCYEYKSEYLRNSWKDKLVEGFLDFPVQLAFFVSNCKFLGFGITILRITKAVSVILGDDLPFIFRDGSF